MLLLVFVWDSSLFCVFYSTSVVTGVCHLSVISGFWSRFWRFMEGSEWLETIGIELEFINLELEKSRARRRWDKADGTPYKNQGNYRRSEIWFKVSYVFQHETCRGEIYSRRREFTGLGFFRFSILFEISIQSL